MYNLWKRRKFPEQLSFSGVYYEAVGQYETERLDSLNQRTLIAQAFKNQIIKLIDEHTKNPGTFEDEARARINELYHNIKKIFALYEAETKALKTEESPLLEASPKLMLLKLITKHYGVEKTLWVDKYKKALDIPLTSSCQPTI